MYQFKGLEDTIVAISTATGQGGIGIVRLSGQQALSIADQLFQSKDQKKPSTFQNFTVHYGWIVKRSPPQMKDEVVDEALLTVMRAPKSYTKQDVVELSCHGGTAVLKSIIKMAVDSGARLAEPGEFTKRAFLNGRIDLPQAEAVLDIIQSKTESFLRVCNHQLKGELSIELESIREKLMEVYIEIEAIVNFPEDQINAKGKDVLLKKTDEARQRVEKLLASSEQGRILKEGIKVVICGKPNVGKSSLLNVFLKLPRAIVSDIAGTTRDTIEETAQIRDIPLQLVDTAGILDPRDAIEEEAVRRSRSSIQGADLVLLVIDMSQDLTEEDENLIKAIKGLNFMVVMNKSDLKPVLTEHQFKERFPRHKFIAVSATQRIGLEKLEGAIVENVCHAPAIDTSHILISNLRHIQALKNCQENLAAARRMLADNLSLEFVSEEIKSAVNGLDHITGRNIDTDLIDNIFSKFCIGK